MRFSIRSLFKRGRESPSAPVVGTDTARQLVARGIAAETAGSAEDALECYREAISSDPCCEAAHYNLALLHLANGMFREAESGLRAALQLRNEFPEAWVALAEALEALGRESEALEALNRAIKQRPRYEGALINAGTLLRRMGRLGEAESIYRRLLALAPDSGEAHFNLATLLKDIGRLAEAEAGYRRAIELDPGFAAAYNSLATVMVTPDFSRMPEAEAFYRKSIELNPHSALAYNNLGNILLIAGRASESEANLRRALQLKPDFPEAHRSLGNTLKDLGRVAEAQASFRRALEINPGDVHAHSSFLMALNYTDEHSRATVFSEHIEWARRHEAPFAAARKAHPNRPDPHRRLRVGYVSPDLRRHSVAYFIEPVIAQHDREAFEVYCYSNVAIPDPVTAHLLALADHARDIVRLSDTDTARLVGEDGIDLLIDLAGHTAGQRLGVFALKPAPVQASYLGYPNTTGLASIDWRITDIHADPPGEGEAFHSERLARLPKTFLCFQPPGDAPPVQPPPAVKNGWVTFGSFNALPKVSPEVVQTWARLMERTPGSRLVLKALGLGDAPSRERMVGEFAKHGIAPDRLTVLPMERTLQAHLGRYHEMDIALDPFPFNGTTTTLEALWMGVPVVALAGDRHAARVGASILANAGLGDLVAENTTEYIALAVRLAGDRERLADMRRSMRERIAGSPLRDAAGFVNALEIAYREIWASWCAGRVQSLL